MYRHIVLGVSLLLSNAAQATSTPVPDLRADLGDAVEQLVATDHHIRDLGVGYERGSLVLSVVLSDGTDAQKLVVRFAEDTGTLKDVTWSSARLPAEERVYLDEQAILAALVDGPALEYGCTDAWITGGDDSAAISEDGYYVVAESASGRAARRLVARSMSRLLDDGMALVSVADADGELEFILSRDGETARVHAALDAQGRVVSAELRLSPGGYAWQSYRRGKTLARGLRGAEVTKIDVRAGDSGRKIALALKSGKRLTIDMGDVLPKPTHWDEEECGC